jgi:hypothetical protein
MVVVVVMVVMGGGIQNLQRDQQNSTLSCGIYVKF